MGYAERHRRTFWAWLWSLPLHQRFRVAASWIWKREARAKFRGRFLRWICGDSRRPTPKMTVTPRKPKDELRLLASKLHDQHELDYALSMVEVGYRGQVLEAMRPYLTFTPKG